MKSKVFVLAQIIVFLLLSSLAQAKVRLPQLVGDGMVLQRGEEVRIWGYADEGEAVCVKFRGKAYKTTAEGGKWLVTLPKMKAGGAYDMQINDLTLHDVLIGDVFLMAGQSNMETTMERIWEHYAEEFASYENDRIRYIKLQHDHSLRGLKDDVLPTRWQALKRENIEPWSAICYFFAKCLYEAKGVPIGIVNTAVGGSTTESWVPKEGLTEFPHYLSDLAIASAPDYERQVSALQARRSQLYNQELLKQDLGIRQRWAQKTLDESLWQSIDLFQNGWASAGGNASGGSHWFRIHFRVNKAQANKQAILRLGNIAGQDSCFVNGKFAGTTGYEYPPRRYRLPVGMLQEGDNVVAVHVNAAYRPSFWQGKPYMVDFGDDQISLLQGWLHRQGCRLLPLPGGEDFANKPSAHYNALINPLANMTFLGAVWYQGESNVGRSEEYFTLVKNMIASWRDLLRKPALPFIVAQLPGLGKQGFFQQNSGMASLREAQRLLSERVSNVGLEVNIDLGEWNDIHPWNKKDVAKRLSLQAERLFYGNKSVVSEGPKVSEIKTEGGKLILTMQESGSPLEQNADLQGFFIKDQAGKWHAAKASTEGEKVIILLPQGASAKALRYAWADNPEGVSLRNTDGLMASPFEWLFD